uniref:Uncharacterized protein n=1 Tax=Aegilops tauschii subsp. strangulata TaxID=200361 RepID=A0A453E832_AEGTS
SNQTLHGQHLRHFFQLLSRSLVGWMVAVGQRPAAAMSQALRPRWSVLWPSRLPVIRQARPGTAAVSFNNRCNDYFDQSKGPTQANPSRRPRPSLLHTWSSRCSRQEIWRNLFLRTATAGRVVSHGAERRPRLAARSGRDGGSRDGGFGGGVPRSCSGEVKHDELRSARRMRDSGCS